MNISTYFSHQLHTFLCQFRRFHYIGSYVNPGKYQRLESYWKSMKLEVKDRIESDFVYCRNKKYSHGRECEVTENDLG